MRFEDWGLIPYAEALERQLSCVQRVAQGESEDLLVFCSHPPIVTKGRSTQEEDIFAWTGPVMDVSRGGRATYHGPSQLVIYPIISLKTSKGLFKAKDIRCYLLNLGTALVDTLKTYHIPCEYKMGDGSATKGVSPTGVWVGSKKIASLGVAVKKWTTYHGLALNLEKDPLAFQGIRPCGYSSETITSVEEVLGAPIHRKNFQEAFIQSFSSKYQEQKPISITM